MTLIATHFFGCYSASLLSGFFTSRFDRLVTCLNDNSCLIIINFSLSSKYFIQHCGTELLQCNTFNKHRYITTILYRLNLVCKTSYYTFCIILTAQNIDEICTTIEFLSVCVATVFFSNNLFMCQV